MGIVKISSVLLTLIFQVLYSIRLIHKASEKDSVGLDPCIHTDPIIFQSPAFCLWGDFARFCWNSEQTRYLSR